MFLQNLRKALLRSEFMALFVQIGAALFAPADLPLAAGKGWQVIRG